MILNFSIFLVLLTVTLFVPSTQSFPQPTAQPSLSLSLVFAERSEDIVRRTDPFFPPDPPSCPKCAQDYPSISSCAQAAPVLANFSMVLFNPGAFIDIIKCACTDTFQAAFPQCVDCFIRTNQTDVLSTPDLPAVLDGMRKVCAVASVIIGNVSSANGELTSSAVPNPTGAASGSHSVHRGLMIDELRGSILLGVLMMVGAALLMV